MLHHLHGGHVTCNPETFDGYGATPNSFSYLPGVGISSQSAGVLLLVSGIGRKCLGHPHDECSSIIGTVVAVPGGMVHCVEGLGE